MHEAMVTSFMPLSVLICCFCPLPWHSLHLIGCVPGWAPLPEQLSQRSERVIEITRSPPLATSSRVSLRSQ